MKLITTIKPDESDIKVLGLVQGVSVRALNILRQFIGDIGGIFGMRQKGFEKIYIKAREEALSEMTRNAEDLGADGVMGIHVNVAQLSNGNSDGYIVFTAHGTAYAKKSKKGTRMSKIGTSYRRRTRSSKGTRHKTRTNTRSKSEEHKK